MQDAKAGALLAALSVACVALAACSQQGQDEMSWARAALQRNQSLEIVSADPGARTFTVRDRNTDEVSVVRADQLIAGVATPGPQGSASAAALAAPAPPAATTATSAMAAPATPPGGSGAEAAAVGPPASSPGSTVAPGELAVPATELQKVIASRALQPGGGAGRVPGQVLAAGPGYSIAAGSGNSIESGSGIEAGSGYGIPAGSGPARAAAVRVAAASGPAIELRHEPIVCQGVKLLHIDNRNLQFDGDAVSADDGCEIYITNSHIRAAGVGVSARAANVHIDNSQIEGDAASIEASDGAQIYTASSKFRGLSRRLDTATVHDLGGNVWN